MEIRIDRAWKKSRYTISRLYVDGKRFGDGKHYCNVLEDADSGLTSDMTVDDVLAKKIYGQTAIPTGKYRVVLDWSSAFKKILPHVLAVKGFTGIRIHSGNKPEDTKGCLLVGRNDRIGWISDSRYWMGLLQAKIENAIRKKEDVWLIVG